jgi:hypothetical protein
MNRWRYFGIPFLLLLLLVGVFALRRLSKTIQPSQALASSITEPEPPPQANPPALSSAPSSNQPQIDSELLRLRGEVAMLRNTVRGRTNKPPSTGETSNDQMITSDQFAEAGLATPQSSIQTLFWAALTGDKERYKQAIVWGEEALRIAQGNNP